MRVYQFIYNAWNNYAGSVDNKSERYNRKCEHNIAPLIN